MCQIYLFKLVMSQKVSTFLYYICQFNKGLDSMVLQAHEVASLVYVKRGEHSTVTWLLLLMVLMGGGGAACNMCDCSS